MTNTQKMINQMDKRSRGSKLDYKIRKEKLDKENHLTGPEYEMIRNLLIGLRDYKVNNEGLNYFSGDKIKNYNKTPIFTTMYSIKQLNEIIDKMGRRMDMFDDGLYNNTCW